MDIPERAQVVIVGGGVIGSSVAYHLAKLGWTDVVLVERSKLTSGTTWHAAGLIVSGGMTTETSAWMSKYTRELYEVLEAETGLSTGFRPVGYLQTGASPERIHKLRREADFLRCVGIERQEISAVEVQAMWPMLDTRDVIAGFYTANEGRADPANCAMSLAAGARQAGVRIVEDTAVTGFEMRHGRVVAVRTPAGDIECDYVVNCGGMWARQIGALAGVSVPLQAAEHAYLITDQVASATPDLPILEDPDRYAYYREETGGLMVGLFEPLGAPWSLDGVPDDFSFGEIENAWDRLAPFLELAMEPLPILKDVGIRKLFTGPESFTPDNGSLMGPSPEVENFWVAAGFNSLGILLGGGAGKIIADWMVEGEPPVDVTEVDIARAVPSQGTRRFREARTVELLGRLHSTGSWPHSHPERARNVRRSVLHDRLAAAGAHFSDSSGWENTSWFAPGVDVPFVQTYGRQGWWSHHEAEHHATRNDVALYDMSSMSNFVVEGPDAERILNHLSGNDVAVEPGRCVYTQWMSPAGKVLADLTVTRLSELRFMVVVAEGFHRRVETMMRRSIGPEDRMTVTDATSGITLISIQGPKSRDLIATISDADLSNEAFPYFTAQELDLEFALGWAFRMSFVGELGWELYVPAEYALGVYDALIREGEAFGLAHAGMETLESTRTEAGRKDYGLDMENTDSPLEAGLGFAVDFDKPGGFVGRDVLLAEKEAGPLSRRLVQFLLDDPEPLLYGEEPIYRNGERVGYLRSGNYGHTLGGAMGFGYVEHEGGVTADYVGDGSYEIQVAGEMFPARASLRPMYDPRGDRVRM